MSSNNDLKLWRGLNLCVKQGCTSKYVNDIPMIYPSDKPFHTIENTYIRGVSDSHSEYLNLHYLCKPIRQHLYYILSIGSVKEKYPIYDKTSHSVKWIIEEVSAKPMPDIDFTFDSLLNLVKYLDPMKNPTDERLFARQSIIAEYIAMVTKQSLSDILNIDASSTSTWDNPGVFVVCKICHQKVHIEHQLHMYIKDKNYPLPTICGFCKLNQKSKK